MSKAQKPEDAPVNLPGDAAPAEAETGMAALDRGRAAVGDALKTIPNSPGVYRMIGADGEVLYVGKAKNLKNRVQSYVNPAGLSTRILRMVSAQRPDFAAVYDRK